jgi:hypothetical protein
MVTSALAPSTYQSYKQKIQKFARFCTEQGKHLLDCNTEDVMRYVSWLAHEGKVAADSLQPYLSAINGLYRDLGLEQIATGDLLRRQIMGFQGMQVQFRAFNRVATPAQVMYNILCSAAFILQEAQLPSMVALRLSRACLSTVVAFLFFARPSANANILCADLVLTSAPQPGIQLLPRGTKGKSKVQPHKLAPLFVPAAVFTAPIGGLPPVDLYGLVVKYVQLRDSCFKGKAPVHMWAVPGDKNITRYTAKHQNSWLKTALNLTLNFPPPGYHWQGHSMRKGAASAASAAGVPLPKICHYGGWSVTSGAVSKHYIDPTCPPTPAGSFFFSWLAQGPPGPVAVPAS